MMAQEVLALPLKFYSMMYKGEVKLGSLTKSLLVSHEFADT